MSSCSLVRVTYANMCFMKWSWNAKTLVTLGDWFGSTVVSMLVKSTCKRSRGAVATMGCKGALRKPPSYWRQHVQAIIDCLIWLAIPGHQKYSCSKKHSCSKDKVQSWPWCPGISMTPIQSSNPMCTFRTMKSNRSPFSPLGMACIGRGHSGESWNSDNSAIPFGPLC